MEEVDNFGELPVAKAEPSPAPAAKVTSSDPSGLFRFAAFHRINSKAVHALAVVLETTPDDEDALVADFALSSEEDVTEISAGMTSLNTLGRGGGQSSGFTAWPSCTRTP